MPHHQYAPDYWHVKYKGREDCKGHAPAHLPQLLGQLCSFLQTPGLLRLHAGRLQLLIRPLVITLHSHMMSVPGLPRGKASLATLQCSLKAHWVLRLHTGRLQPLFALRTIILCGSFIISWDCFSDSILCMVGL